MPSIATIRQFPVCVVESANVGPGTEYPVGLTLEQSFALLWRMKRMAGTANVGITTAITTRIEDRDPYTTEATASGEADFNVGNVDNAWKDSLFGESLADERALVCPRVFGISVDGDDKDNSFHPITQVTAGSDPNTDSYLPFSFLIDLTAPIHLHESLYYPNLVFVVFNYNFSLHSHQDPEIRPNATWSEFGQMSFFDGSVTAPLYVDTNPGNYGDDVINFQISGTANIDFRIHEEWAFN